MSETPKYMSIRAYARHRGLASDNSVRKAIAAGRIKKEKDGTIDVAKADQAWPLNTDPAQQRGQAGKPRADQAAAPTDEADRPVPSSTVDAARARLEAAGKKVESESGLTLVDARTAELLQKMEQRQIRIDRDRGALVDRAKALDLIFTAARKERDALTTWPARSAAIMASELKVDKDGKVDPHALEMTLDKHVRSLLGELGEFVFDLPWST